MGSINTVAFCPRCSMPSSVGDYDSHVIRAFNCNFCGFKQSLEHYSGHYDISDSRVDMIGRVFDEDGGRGYIKMKDPETGLPRRYLKEPEGWIDPQRFGGTWDDVVLNVAVVLKTFGIADAVYYSGDFTPDSVQEYTDPDGVLWLVSNEPCYSYNKIHLFTDEDRGYDEIAKIAIERGEEAMGLVKNTAIDYDTFVKLKECTIKWYEILCDEIRRGERKAPNIECEPMSEEEMALRKKPLPDTIEGRFNDERFPKIKCFHVTDESPIDMKNFLMGEPSEIGAAELKLLMDSLGIKFYAPGKEDVEGES